MRKSSVEIVSPNDAKIVREFASLPARIYGPKARCFSGAFDGFVRPETGRSPFLEGREFQALAARAGGTVVVRAVALVDRRYCNHWGQKLGHIIMYEALPDARDSSLHLLGEAFQWLGSRRCTEVRAGFGPLEPGFLIDNYETLNPRMLRHTAPWYHSFLKEGGFEVEKGGAEYIMPVTRESVTLFEGQRKLASTQGYRIASLSSLPADDAVTDTLITWNATFAGHWGLAPMTRGEIEMLLQQSPASRIRESSSLLYSGSGDPVGIVLAGSDSANGRSMLPSRYSVLTANTFAVGIDEQHRGKALGTAMASHTYLSLIAGGAKLLSYGLVLDDNVPSRRSARKLGGQIFANYVTYRAALY